MRARNGTSVCFALCAQTSDPRKYCVLFFGMNRFDARAVQIEVYCSGFLLLLLRCYPGSGASRVFVRS